MIDLTIAVPVIIALVEVCKRTGLPKKLAPAVSVILGVSGFYLFCATGDITGCLFEGLIAGLTASGLYAGVKNTIA